ncbi:MAG: hypothetical protein CVU39_23865 [Chloroflexi bacterium HGW-Chloroflexi-10]|nr:MAG: hypothetical protein CVU39_23865 [Chloroflexi bacterium HGW-Chloroflexi-10]
MDKVIFEYCEFLRGHVEKVIHGPTDKKLSHQAINVYQKAAISGILEKEDLDQILLAARNKHLGPFYIGTDLLTELFNRFPIIENEWRILANSNLSHERWAAITSLNDERIPIKFVEELVSKAINDKSARVRFFAVERIYSRKLFSLIPELKQRLEIEKNEKVIEHLKWVLRMLERGYNIRQKKEKDDFTSIEVDVSNKHLVAGSMILKENFTDEDIIEARLGNDLPDFF